MENEKIDYREESKKMLDEITDDWILKQVYRCIKNITKEEQEHGNGRNQEQNH